MKILVLAEHDQHGLKPTSLSTLSAAFVIADSADVVVIGHQCEAVANTLAQVKGVDHVLLADALEYAHQLPENIAPLLVELMQDYDYLLAPASTFGKNILPRVAALLDVAMVSDVIKILGSDTFVRPMYAGNALATLVSQDTKKILSIRSTAFPAKCEARSTAAGIEKITRVIANTQTEFVSAELALQLRPDLTTAKIIVSGGRGLKSAENFKLLEALADQLGAAIGATRAAVDAGFAPNDLQVGQTGKVVAPELYIAIGISGAIQHLAGMKDSKVIVAINHDADAPIFQIADYGLVADLFTALTELQKELIVKETQ